MKINSDAILKQQYLTRFSAVMKGIIVYKKETAELLGLMKKYPEIALTYSMPFA